MKSPKISIVYDTSYEIHKEHCTVWSQVRADLLTASMQNDHGKILLPLDMK